MRILTEEQASRINRAMSHWRQGDFVLGSVPEAVHVADLSLPHSPPSVTAAARLLAAGGAPDSMPVAVEDLQTQGHVLLSHTCNVVRDCNTRPHVVMAPLVPPPGGNMDDVRLMRRPRFIYIPGAERLGLAADLDRATTVEKAVLASLRREPGWETDGEIIAFAEALILNCARFAFPDDFELACRKLKGRIFRKHHKPTAEGKFLQELEEIRVRALPSWDHEKVGLHWYHVVSDTVAVNPTLEGHLESLMDRFDQSGRFKNLTANLHTLDDISAREYRMSRKLEYDSLTLSWGERREADSADA